MLTDQDLRELLSYQAKSPVLSVYLNTDPVQGNADAHRLHLRGLLKEVNQPNDVQIVLRYFDHEHDWSGRSVAVFSCAAENYFRTYAIAVPIRSRVRAGDRPYVKPLADLLDLYGGYGVVVVDKQGARLFSFHLGDLREQDGLLGEAVRHTKRGGGSQAAGRKGGVAGQTNYAEEVVDRNIKDAVEYATRFFSENHVRRVLIGGSEDNISLFRSQLPKAFQSLVVGTFPVSMNASQNEIREKAMEIGRNAERQRDNRIVSTVVTNAAKGRGGTIHLEDTLHALRDGRVQTLIIRDGYRAPGGRCKSCGYLTGSPPDSCPYCGGEFQEVPDTVEEAVRQVMQSGGEVEVLHHDPGVGDFKSIGALLRY
jgi:peptide subunit release factor 1 (eRF1)